jgi:hypothetical protein
MTCIPDKKSTPRERVSLADYKRSCLKDSTRVLYMQAFKHPALALRIDIKNTSKCEIHQKWLTKLLQIGKR